MVHRTHPKELFSDRVINLLLTKLASQHTGRLLAFGLLCSELAALGPYVYCKDDSSVRYFNKFSSLHKSTFLLTGSNARGSECCNVY